MASLEGFGKKYKGANVEAEGCAVEVKAWDREPRRKKREGDERA